MRVRLVGRQSRIELEGLDTSIAELDHVYPFPFFPLYPLFGGNDSEVLVVPILVEAVQPIQCRMANLRNSLTAKF